ncbi:MAG: tail fiber domain-containing protein, partial [Bacteroidales bacterium]|nr:tail fiber domain-containing protein [Bacteroidales bacterium]
ISLSTSAQIKLRTDGKIGLGTLTPSKDLEIKRNNILFNFDNSYSPADLTLQIYYDMPQFYPTISGKGFLGTYDKRWGYAYFTRLYSVYHYTISSDARLKTNLEPVSNSLDKVLKMKAYTYDLNIDQLENNEEKSANTTNQSQIGFLAQDLLKFIPEVVEYDSAADEYGVKYGAIVPVLAEAIKEQNNIIMELIKEVEKLKDKEKSDEKISETESNTPFLIGQNQPNPFNEYTDIQFYIPNEIKSAVFFVYDLQGKQIMSRKIIERGNGEIIIYSSELQPGMYNYLIIADGNIIGTKQMILTR